MTRLRLTKEDAQARLEEIQLQFKLWVKPSQISKELGISKELVSHYLHNLGLTRDISWSLEEEEIIKNMYATTTIDALVKLLPNRSMSSIRRKAFELNIKKIIVSHQSKPQSRLDVLLEDKLESFYWAGFIAADGCVTTKSNYNIDIKISQTDYVHLLRYCKYIEHIIPPRCFVVAPTELVTGHSAMCAVASSDSVNVPKIIEKFDFKQKKTYNPPSPEKYEKFTLDQITSFFIGFIDGDGTISSESRKLKNGERGKVTPRISIENYYTWEPFMDFLKLKIYSRFNQVPKSCYIRTRYGKSDMVVCRINHIHVVKALKLFALSNKLPVLQRKWDKIILDGGGN
jgi:predicted transcriptional regulator